MHDRLVIFDCDGVLVDSEPLSFEGFRRVFAHHGMAITFEHFRAGMGQKQPDLLAAIARVSGHTLPPGATDEIWPETRALFATELRPTPGLAAFLAGLTAKRCVASSSTLERIRMSLEVTGLSRFFGEAIYSTFMVKNGKPAPDIFFYAAERLGVAPAHCCVIEDSPAGIRGAVTAGMAAFGYTGGGHTDPGHARRLIDAGADAVAASWTEMAQLLENRGFADAPPTAVFGD
jgi:HAD superfamily hydrolase (TIGR01509 family)